MIDFEMDIPTEDGAMNTFVAHPNSGGPFPPVFMYMPASSIRDELRDMARRLAKRGYIVLLPNLYYRMIRVLDADSNRLFDDDYEPVKTFMNVLNNDYTNTRSRIDTAAMIAFADGDDRSRRGQDRRYRLLHGWSLSAYRRHRISRAHRRHGLDVWRQAARLISTRSA
jgi:carboxymethylenebutenolidase